jgi:drug/metabolite transporter (DMT)-like permease
MNTKKDPSLLLLVLAFAAVYIIWGSTYLAIVYVLETLPPFLMAGARFLFAGSLLYVWARFRHDEKPTLAHWGRAFLIGGMLFLLGNGSVVWAEQHVPSGIVALLITTEPIWIVILEWILDNHKPNRGVLMGLVIGFIGTIVLIGPSAFSGIANANLLGCLIVLASSFFWAAGSLYLSRAVLPSSPLLMTGMQMLAGGVLLTLTGTSLGEWSHVNILAISQRSILAWLYLTIFGSLIAFTAYSWLARVAPPSRVSTYAYVNPAIAVLLGWLLKNEPISKRTLIAGVLLVSAVVLITKYRQPNSEFASTKQNLLEKAEEDNLDNAVCLAD